MGAAEEVLISRLTGIKKIPFLIPHLLIPAETQQH